MNQAATLGDQRIKPANGDDGQQGRQERVMATAKVRTKKATLAHEFAELVGTFRALVDPYRPEAHYMRGPGPKWRAKHAPAAASADTIGVPTLVHAKG
jgi:hypothetical protein